MSAQQFSKHRCQELWPGEWSAQSIGRGYVYSVVTGDHRIDVFNQEEVGPFRAEISTPTSMLITTAPDLRELLKEVAFLLNWNTAQTPQAKTKLSRLAAERQELTRERASLICRHFNKESYNKERLNTLEERLDKIDMQLHRPSLERLDRDVQEMKQMRSEIERLLHEAKQIIQKEG